MRNPGFAILLFASAALVASVAPARAQQEHTWDGHTLQPLYNTNGVTCDHWVVWVYTDETTNPQPGRGWGEQDGASAGEALQKWQRARDTMERTLNSAHTGYEVHMGPVCVVKRSTGNAVPQSASKPESRTINPNAIAQEKRDLTAGNRISGYADGSYNRPAVVTRYAKADSQNCPTKVYAGTGVKLLAMWSATLSVSFAVSKGIITRSSFSEYQGFVRCVGSDEAKGLPKTTIEIKTRSAATGNRG
jgi:hypothetical protein